jgi:hypothetical protein
MHLPEEFLVKNAMNFRGGVERSMMSTTRNKAVAVQVLNIVRSKFCILALILLWTVCEYVSMRVYNRATVSLLL